MARNYDPLDGWDDDDEDCDDADLDDTDNSDVGIVTTRDLLDESFVAQAIPWAQI